MHVQITSHFPAFHAALFDELARRLDSATTYLRDEVRVDISHPCDLVHHSRPGDPPFLESGDLWQSYRTLPVDRATRAAWVAGQAPWALTAWTGSDLYYALRLELGYHYPSGARLAPRPHLRRNLYNHAADLRAILCAPL
jgi:hypothetical protein